MKRKILVFVLVVLSIMSFVACKDDEEIVVPPTLSVNQAVITLKPFETFDIVVTYTGNESVSFSVNNSSVAIVDGGHVTAVAVGEAIVTVSAGELSKKCYVTVVEDHEIPVILVQNTADGKVLLNENSQYELDVKTTFNGNEVEAEYEFNSSDESVITVDANGVIKAVGIGDAYVFVSASWRNFDKETIKSKVLITVKKTVMFDLTAEDKSIFAIDELNGISYEKTTRVNPSLTIGNSVVTNGFTFVSSDDDVLSVDDNGVVTGKKSGKATVTCYYQSAEVGEVYATAEIAVETVIAKKEQTKRQLFERSLAPTTQSLSVIFDDLRNVTAIVDVTDGEKQIPIEEDGTININDAFMTTGERTWCVYNDAYAYITDMLVVDNVIRTPSDLKSVLPKGGDKYIILGADIPNVGDYSGDKNFTGTLDGMGHTISDINIKNRGLFGNLTGGAVIKNIAMSNVTLNHTTGTFGVQADSATLENVSIWITGTTPTEELPCGGVVFQIGGSLNLKNCVVYAEGVENKNFGAVVGAWWGGKYNLSNSYFVTDGTPCGLVFKTASKENDNAFGVQENSKGSWDYIFDSKDRFIEEISKSDSRVVLDAFNKDVWTIESGVLPSFKTDASFKAQFAEEVQGDLNGGELFYFSKNLQIASDYADKHVKDGKYQVVLPDTVPGDAVLSIYIGANLIEGFSFNSATRTLSIPILEFADVISGITSVLIQTDECTVTIKATVADFVITSADEFKSILPTAGQPSGEAYYYIVIGNDISDVEDYINKDQISFKGTLDGKGHVIRNLSMNSDSHALFSIVGGLGVIKDLAIINSSYVSNHGCAVLVNQLYGRVENVFVSGVTNGATGLVNANYTGSTIKNCIINVSHMGESKLTNPAIGNSQGNVIDCYAVTNYVGGVAPNATGGGLYATSSAMLNSLNKTLPEGFGDQWSFDGYGNLLYSGQTIVRFSQTIQGTKNGGELFYFSKDVTNLTGYASSNIQNGYYKIVLAQDIGAVQTVTIGGKEIQGFSYSNKTLLIPVSVISEVNTGATQMTIGALSAEYIATVTVADVVIESKADLLYAFQNVFTGYVILGNDVEWDSTSYTRTQNVALTGTFDGKGYAVKNFKINASGIYFQIQYGGKIQNVAFLDVTNSSAYGLFANETANMNFDNVAITYKASGAGGLVGMMSGTTAVNISNTIIVYNGIASSTNAGIIACTYKSSTNLTLTNSYFISDGNPFKTKNADDTKGIYDTVAGQISANLAGLKTASNNLENFGDLWSIDNSGNLLFGDEIILIING